MLRFYRQYAEQMLLALLYLRDRIGNDFTDVARYTRNNWREFDTTRFPWQTDGTVNSVRIIHETNDMDNDLTEMITELQKQISSYHERDGIVDGGKFDKDLIDTIVRCLQLPYARNRLSGDVLDVLKRAVLLPEELVGLKERMQREEMSCTQCGHKFMNGEIGSFHKERERTQVLCTNCYHPTRFAGGCLKHSIEVPTGLHKVLSKELERPCVYCAAEVAEAAQQPQEVILGTREVPPEDLNVIRGGRWAGRGAAINPNPGRGQVIRPTFATITTDGNIPSVNVPQPPAPNLNAPITHYYDGLAPLMVGNEGLFQAYQQIVRDDRIRLERDPEVMANPIATDEELLDEIEMDVDHD